MLSVTRINIIKSLLLEQKSVSVSNLSAHFDVAPETIRRDLKHLEEEGVAERIHGGAILSEKMSSSFSNSSLKPLLKENKDAMAELASQYVKSGQCIFLDTSTTTSHVIDKLVKLLNLTIVTNSLDVMNLCSNVPDINLIALGGKLNHNNLSFSGSKTLSSLQKYNFDVSILSCRTLNRVSGLNDSDPDNAHLKKFALAQSTYKILLADHTKFDKLSFANVCSFKDIDLLITDQEPSKEWIDYLALNDVTLVY